VFASQTIALANRSHEPNWSEVANSMRIPTKLETMDGLFQPQCSSRSTWSSRGEPRRESEAPERWSYMIGMDRFNWLQLLKKLPNLTMLGALEASLLHLAPRNLSVSSLLRQRGSCLSLFILDLYELYRSISQRQITSKICAGYTKPL